jgi:hypothetical protein
MDVRDPVPLEDPIELPAKRSLDQSSQQLKRRPTICMCDELSSEIDLSEYEDNKIIIEGLRYELYALYSPKVTGKIIMLVSKKLFQYGLLTKSFNILLCRETLNHTDIKIRRNDDPVISGINRIHLAQNEYNKKPILLAAFGPCEECHSHTTFNMNHRRCKSIF